MHQAELIFHGVRGSYPVPGQSVAGYGGNTSSIWVKSTNQQVILDAGTGIIKLGSHLKKFHPQRKHIDIFLTHLHIDHIQGFPFFEPVFDPAYTIRIHGVNDGTIPLSETIYSLFNQPLSPIGNDGIKAKLVFVPLDPENPQPIEIGGEITVDYIKEAHPRSGVLLYRLAINGKRVVYATDVETPSGFGPETSAFIKDVDMLIHDSQYFDADYHSTNQPKKGYGHSTVSMAATNAVKAGVKTLFLYHYDPGYSDQDIDRMHREAREIFPDTHLSEELKKIIL